VTTSSDDRISSEASIRHGGVRRNRPAARLKFRDPGPYPSDTARFALAGQPFFKETL
jgi:hypothetical protein